MGRSVSSPSNAVVVYDHFESEGDEWDQQDDWDWYVDSYLSRIMAKYPSVSKDDGWIGREDRVIASNRFAKFGVSEYCGLVSLWVVARDDFDWYEDLHGLAENWVAQIAPGFQEEFGSMVRVGGMSNGEGVYVAKGPEPIPDDISGDSGHVVVNGMLCG